MITTTLNRIRQHSPCYDGWTRLLKGLNKTAADDEPLPFAKIVELNSLDDALWCCRAEPQYDREWRLYAVWCARQAQHLMTDPRSVAALDVAERYARRKASAKELVAARKAARAAARETWSAAAWAARAAARETWSAAAWAALAAGAGYAVLAAQTAEFLRVVTETEAR